MKKVNEYWNQLPKCRKILFTILLVLLIGIFTYFALGSPPLTPMLGFRRAEKANMVGPSEILDELTVEQYYPLVYNQPRRNKDQAIIAQSHNCDILYIFPKDLFYAYPKTQSASLYCLNASTPKLSNTWGDTTVPLHLILFDRNTQAFRADIEFRVNMHDGSNVLFQERATRQFNGFFYFPVTPEDYDDVTALTALQIFCFDYRTQGKPSISVKLYDENGQLLSSETILPGPSQT